MPEDSNETVKIVRNKKTDKRKVNSDGNQARDNNIDPNNSAPIKRQRTISKKGSQINTESEDMSDSEVVTFNPRNDSFGESASEKDIDERDASFQERSRVLLVEVVHLHHLIQNLRVKCDLAKERMIARSNCPENILNSFC